MQIDCIHIDSDRLKENYDLSPCLVSLKIETQMKKPLQFNTSQGTQFCQPKNVLRVFRRRLVSRDLIFLCFCKLISKFTKGCLVLVGKDIELDAVGRQFEPYPYRRMRLHAGGALVV